MVFEFLFWVAKLLGSLGKTFRKEEKNKVRSKKERLIERQAERNEREAKTEKQRQRQR